MNGNHSQSRGRFCTREEARRVDPAACPDADALYEELAALAQRVLSDNRATLTKGGKAYVLEHEDGVIEMVVLSAEGVRAFEEDTTREQNLEAFARRRGKVGGRPDSHNIRKGIRRWRQRNSEIIRERNVCLRVIREQDVLRLSAVWMPS